MTGLTRATRIGLRVLLVELVVLAATGVQLFFRYRPSTSQAWDLLTVTPASAVGGVRFVHRLTSIAAVWTVIAVAVLLVIEPIARVRWRRSATLAAGTLLAVVAAAGSGYLLPWDQLALWAVSIGSDMRGYTPLLDDKVRFVLIGGKEIAKTTLLRWVVIHGLLGIGSVALTLAAARRLRGRSSGSSSSAPVVGREADAATRSA